MRPGVPGRDVQLDHAIPGYPEGDDVIEARLRVVAKVARRRDADQPFLAAERAQAWRYPPVPRDPGEAEPDMRQMHDPQPRLAVAQDKPCLAGRHLRVVTGLGALAARTQRRDHLTIGRKRLRRQLPDVQHTP